MKKCAAFFLLGSLWILLSGFLSSRGLSLGYRSETLPLERLQIFETFPDLTPQVSLFEISSPPESPYLSSLDASWRIERLLGTSA